MWIDLIKLAVCNWQAAENPRLGRGAFLRHGPEDDVHRFSGCQIVSLTITVMITIRIRIKDVR